MEAIAIFILIVVVVTVFVSVVTMDTGGSRTSHSNAGFFTGRALAKVLSHHHREHSDHHVQDVHVHHDPHVHYDAHNVLHVDAATDSGCDTNFSTDSSSSCSSDQGGGDCGGGGGFDFGSCDVGSSE